MLHNKINHLLVQQGKREVKSRGDIEAVMLESGKHYAPPSKKMDWVEKRARTALGEN